VIKGFFGTCDVTTRYLAVFCMSTSRRLNDYFLLCEGCSRDYSVYIFLRFLILTINSEMMII
jgi:hypothetical protein